MAKKFCKTCLYHQAPDVLPHMGYTSNWCSNSTSPFLNRETSDDNTCEGYTRRGKKAPLGIRVAKKLTERID